MGPVLGVLSVSAIYLSLINTCSNTAGKREGLIGHQLVKAQDTGDTATDAV